ncbi:Crp/Fnr family transcriptional regulator [Haoranjiania flava]|uniref:Crp/Fnr family transcriptional regulator n=1 Tax=Haoranjiania flava TaxID=1856322 RepID=A0AAE3IKB7_9BACT|nr:Crp/Fnr family transcriptional regulator [Haoranjiania flava]MCU7693787.1 Crp/Fnr family transcriptional regulator [Haoranjiania flava]
MPTPYQQLFDVISRDVQLADDDKNEIAQRFLPKEYKKNVCLLRAGEVAKEVYFVLEGAIHQYYIDEAGNEKSCAFVFENEFTTDLESFSNKSISPSYLTTLKATNCLVITCNELQELIKNVASVHEFFRILVERIAAISFRRTKSLLSLSPEQRFNELMQETPEIFQKLPQRLIAQYIGMAPESLSRMKRRMYEQQKS